VDLSLKLKLERLLPWKRRTIARILHFPADYSIARSDALANDFDMPRKVAKYATVDKWSLSASILPRLLVFPSLPFAFLLFTNSRFFIPPFAWLLRERSSQRRSSLIQHLPQVLPTTKTTAEMVKFVHCLQLALLPAALAAPAPAPAPIVAVPHPMITARASLTDRTPTRVQERDLISSIEGFGSYLGSVLGSFPSYVASGVPNFFQDFPTGTAVEKSLGISSTDLAATPTQVLNIP
jgi:hypothetical protein